MLTKTELHNLLFENRTYFDNQENLSKYSREELQHIHYLLHELENYNWLKWYESKFILNYHF